ncbi:unnamed protein product [Candida verbasci]|uniref:Conserved oligomeric Golgi complex subunit 5 n=1 Tax=Candida verbasci TaxID=1227364 RepID=A0A9W4X943_9ASCO|nr:unnamed protein product [Candida verbasci]
MVSKDYETNELEDFESFLESDFDARKLSNNLLLITNGEENPELDLITPIKKLKFDIDECNKRMSKISSNNYLALISNFSEFDKHSDILKNKINPQIERINQPFKRIKNEIIDPFDESIKLNNAIRKIHQTLQLLRNLSFFIFLIQQLEEMEMKFKNEENGKDLLKISKLHKQLAKLYEISHIEKNDTLSIKLIRDYQSIEITRRKNLVYECSNFIINEFNHTSKIQNNNTQLMNNVLSLYILDPEEFFTTFDKSTINKQLTISINQLSKALQSPRNFTAILSEINEEIKDYFTRLESCLRTWTVNTDNDEKLPILEKILIHYNTNSLSRLFWPKLNSKFKRNIVATMARGGPIAKNLKVYSQGLKTSINEIFKNQNEEANLFLDSLSMIDYQ